MSATPAIPVQPIDPSLGLPYPAGGAWKALYRLPLLLWRMGLGPILGQVFMVITTTGRKSGQPRRVVLEYHMVEGRKVVMAGWAPQSDWYRNIQASPHVTIQTAHGTERVVMQRVTDEAHLRQLFTLVSQHPLVQAWMTRSGTEITLERFIAEKDNLYLFTFAPTSDPTPPPLAADLRAVWLIPAALFGIGLLRRLARPR